ncbi:hypothetical protein BDQ12DRAFT_62134 [Crucibulum laeve]|uniref:F-box domain-containing protein n=1 Tax=Crucibulum laeve TaxID=68775 RepID=A0A5C3M2J6_9AGAR|nr:hypothetical protein BDQ12DRAFT_62134 [Crucibulum laeve]
MFPMLTSTFPQELSDHVVGYFSKDSLTLKSCSLVSRGWLISSRAHLFHDIRIDDHNFDEFTSLIIHSLSTIHPFVKRLELAPEKLDCRWLRRLVPFLTELTSVINLRIQNVDWSALHSYSRSSFLFNFAPTLTELRINHMSFDSFKEVVDIVSAFPLLVSLSLDHVQWKDPNFDPPTRDSGKYLPPSVRSLHLGTCIIRHVVHWLLSHEQHPTINHLDLGPLHQSDIPTTSLFMALSGPALQSIKVRFDAVGGGIHANDDMVDIPMFTPPEGVCHTAVKCAQLGYLTELRYFEIKSYVHYSDHQRSTAIFLAPSICSSFISPLLEEVVFNVALSRVGELDMHAIDWQALDSAFDRKELVRLQKVRFAVDGSANRKALASLLALRLPVCHSRGILYIDQQCT